MEEDSITLKWGTWKEWNAVSDKAEKLRARYSELGESAGAMTQHDTDEQKKIICKMIDLVRGKIYLEWDGEYVSKKAAKEYVMNYGKEK